MAVNSYKDDEQSVERSKVQTLLRLFRYLLDYRWQIILVLLIMGYGVAVSLVNPCCLLLTCLRPPTTARSTGFRSQSRLL